MFLHFYSTLDNLRKLANGEEIILYTKAGAKPSDNIHVSIDITKYGIRETQGSSNAYWAFRLPSY